MQVQRVFIYWDNSNIYHEAQRLAEDKEGTPEARKLLRINFEQILGRVYSKSVQAQSVDVG